MSVSTASTSADASLLARLHPELYLSHHLSHGSRPSSSSSSPLAFPEVDVNLSPLSSSSSSSKTSTLPPSPSSLIKYGATTILCNITPRIIYPLPLTSSNDNQGGDVPNGSTSGQVLIPNLSLTALSSPSHDFTSRAPSSYAQSITERLYEFLDGSLPFDKKVLEIPIEGEESSTTGEKKRSTKARWCLFADCTVLGFDGGLLEASLLGIVVALRQVRLPKAYYSLDEQTVIASSNPSDCWSLRDHMTSFPIAFGLGIYKGTLLTTPSSFESDLAFSSLSLCLAYPDGKTASSSSPRLTAFHATGPVSAVNVPLVSQKGSKSKQDGQVKLVQDEDLLDFIVQVAGEKGKEIVRLIRSKEEQARGSR